MIIKLYKSLHIQLALACAGLGVITSAAPILLLMISSSHSYG